MRDDELSPTLSARSTVARRLAPRPKQGESVGRFVVEHLLGAGGMGVVYAARDTTLDRRIALKFLAEHSSASPEARERFLAEARAMAQLSHPNVVTIYDIGTWDSHVYIAMELVDGATLRDWVALNLPDPLEAWLLLRQAARGLEAAHAAGIVHRDFKPTNVFVTRTGTVKVGDFGLASTDGVRAASPEVALGSTVELTGGVQGTPAYMAPEQYTGQSVDARADQFAFCVTAYEVFFGSRPWTEQDINERADSLQRGGPARPPKSTVLPEELFTVLKRGLSGAPQDRYPSISKLVSALEGQLTRTSIAEGIAARAMSEIWNPAVRAEIQRGFAATGRLHARDATMLIAQQLDERTAEWVQVRRELLSGPGLAAAQAEGRIHDQLRELDRVAMELEELIAVFCQDVDGELVDRSAELLYQLDRASRAVSLARSGHVTGGSAASRSLQQLLARAQALYHAGKLSPSESLARDVIRGAQQAGDYRFEGRASLLCSHLRIFSEGFGGAEADARAAIDAAARARDHATLAKAWGHLVFILAHTGRAQEALLLRSAAEASALGTDDELAQAWVLNDVGAVLERVGELEEATDYLLRAAALKERVLGPTHPDVGLSLINAAHTLAQSGEFDRAEVAGERALASLEGALGAGHPLLSNALHILQELALRTGDPDRVLLLQKRVEKIQVTEFLRQEHAVCVAEAWFAKGEQVRAHAAAVQLLGEFEAGNELRARVCMLAARSCDGPQVREFAEQARAALGESAPYNAKTVQAWLDSLAAPSA